MADQTDFKHITVNPAEPDDIVIHAGAPQGDSQVPSSTGESAQPAAAKSPPQKKSAPSSKASSTYHATTLEDIQGFKMSTTQIAVIILALAAIAAFVVWYLVFS